MPGGADARVGRTGRRAVRVRRPGAAGAGRSSAAGHPGGGERSAGRAVGGVRPALRPSGPAVDPAREAAAGVAAAGVLFDPLGAPADGAARVRPPVPLVRRARDRGPGVGRLDLLQEPRPPARGRGGGALPRHGAGAARGQAPAFGRPLLRRRHPDPGLGEHEELPPEGRSGRAAGRAGATTAAISTASGGATRPMPRPPTPKPGCSAKARARRPGSASWVICSWRTVRAWWSGRG